ncbi:MAG: preprotein translocase subunit SecG [Alphaproteobacteria bacterium]|nr:preprotein translocase subunit SecG [Alphaproteobacteria bacterium]
MVILVVFHIIVVISLVVTVLLQRSEGGALGVGGSGKAFLGRRGAGDMLTRITMILSVVFFTTSILLALLAQREVHSISFIDRVSEEQGKQEEIVPGKGILPLLGPFPSSSREGELSGPKPPSPRVDAADPSSGP